MNNSLKSAECILAFGGKERLVKVSDCGRYFNWVSNFAGLSGYFYFDKIVVDYTLNKVN